MKGRFVTELHTYQEVVEASKSFYIQVFFKEKQYSDVRSTNMPIDALEAAIDDIALIDEGHSLPIWGKIEKKLVIIPAREILSVVIGFND